MSRVVLLGGRAHLAVSPLAEALEHLVAGHCIRDAEKRPAGEAVVDPRQQFPGDTRIVGLNGAKW